MKKSIVTIVAFMLFALAGFAQEKYEYQTVVLGTNAAAKPMLFVTTKDSFKEIDVDKNDCKPGMAVNTTPAIKYITELNKDGWEVINAIQNQLNQWSFFLKRKVK